MMAKRKGIYGKRWEVETVFSVKKRKMEDSIRARRKEVKEKEVIQRIIAYDIH